MTGTSLGWLFGNSEKRIIEKKAEEISQSIFWDGGSAKVILDQCTKDEIDSMYDQVQAYEAAAACVLFW